MVELTRRYYVEDDDSVLPRNIANRAAFENAMSLDIAMGGSTNTILHLPAAAQEAELDFTMADIDALSRNVPQLCKVAPSTPLYHMEDVHRAGGVLAILVSSRARADSIVIATRSTAARSVRPSRIGISPPQIMPLLWNGLRQGLRVSRRNKRLAKQPVGLRSISIVREAAFAQRSMLTPRRVA